MSAINTTTQSVENEEQLQPTQPQPPSKVVTLEEFKRIQQVQKKAQKLLEKQKKARIIRWKQKFANAKIEDLIGIAEDIDQFERKVADVLNNLTFELYILQESLLKTGAVTKEIIDETRKYEDERAKKFVELKNDKEMSKEDKLKIAAEWRIDPESLELEKDGNLVPESTQQT